MLAKLKTGIKKIEAYIGQIRDVRAVGMFLFLVVVLMISWSGVKVIDTNYGLQRKIAALEQQNEVQDLSNQNLKLRNDYYASNQYLELAARQNFGLAAPGEMVLIVPKSVALKYTIDSPNKPTVVKTAASKQPAWQHNLQSWMDFFLHRQRVE